MLRDTLQKYWGFDSFLPLQREAMESVLQGRDSLVVLPTGGGKSLCYQAPAVEKPGTAVVVQRRVDAKAAGVALGADPVTGQNGQGNAGRPQRRWGTGSPLSFAPPFPGAYVQWAGGRRLFDHAGQIAR